MLEDSTDNKPEAETNESPTLMKGGIFSQCAQIPIFSFKGRLLKDQMKTKNFYALILFLLVTITTLWLLVDPSPNFHTIVSETQRKITNIKNIHHTKAELLEVDKKYLEALGFQKSIFPTYTVTVTKVTNKSKNSIKPVLVIPVASGAYEDATRFLKSVYKHVPGTFVAFYDLGLSGKENTLLKKTCNITKNNCEVKQLQFNKYPSHIHSLRLRSYVPICIQESLNQYGAIIWSDPNEYFLTGDISSVISRARDTGIIAWTIKDTTSSITYEKMFTYFDVKTESYYFHRAIKTNHLILFNTDFVRTKIMLPWTKCALVEECVSPTGSQNTGYCTERKPRYLYTGCHHYEQSALNLILGKLFSYDEREYSTNVKIFGVELPNKNSTMSTDSASVEEDKGPSRYSK